MIQTTISGATVQDFKTNVFALAEAMGRGEHVPSQMDLPLTPMAPSSVETSSTAKRGRPSKKEKGDAVPCSPAPDAAANALPSSPVAPAADLGTQADAAASNLTQDDMRKCLGDLIGRGDAGAKKGFEILQSFGAPKISLLKPADFAAFQAKCIEALAT